MYSVSDLQKLVQMLDYLGFAGNIAPPHSVVIGGGWVTPGASGTLFASNGVSADPSFQTLASLGIQPAGAYAPLPLPAGSVGSAQLGANVVGDGQLAWGNVLGRTCDSIAALSALSISIYTRAFVTGYYAAGDGGDGAYYYSAGSSATVNGGTVIAASGGVGRWLLISTGPLSVRQFGAKGDGSTNDISAINTAISYQASLGGGTVTIPPGVYIIGSSIIMGNGVKLLGQNLPTITQANGANVAPLIDFSGSAAAASLEGCIVDGNRSNNTDTLNTMLVNVRSNNDVTIYNNVFQNSNGYCVTTNAARTSVISNRFMNSYGSMIGIFNGGGGGATTDAYHKIIGNRCISGICQGGLFFGSSNYGLIQGNSFIGTAIGGRGNRLQVSISGNTVTWVSGPTFGIIQPGMFVVVNGGMEFMVTAVGSSTSLTVNGSPPTLTNVAASIGTGDMMGIVNSSFCTISENIVIGQSTFGIALSLGGASSQCSCNNITNNVISYAGKNAINVSWDSGTGFLFNNSFIGNKIFNPGNSPGGATADKIAMFISSQTAGKVVNTHIDANSFETDTGDGQAPYWLGTDGNVSTGSVAVGHNYAVGFVNGGIFNDVLSVSLGAGWGSTASVSSIISNGHSMRFTVTSSGSGIAAGPSVTITKACDTPDNVTLINAKLQTTTGTLTLLWGEQTSTPGTWQLNYPSTPISGDTYVIECQA